jgi:hypothetical protein
VHEVETLLLQPLPKPIPCEWYNQMDLSSLDESVKDEINNILCASKNGSNIHDWAGATLKVVTGISANPFGVDRGEFSLSGDVQTFIKDVFVQYAKFHEFTVNYDNNKSCPVLSTTKSSNTTSTRITQTRRDGIGYINDVPFFIEEDKELIGKQSEAEKQLSENTGLMLPQFYHRVPFVVACTVTGPIMKFFCLFRKGNCLYQSHLNLSPNHSSNN